MSDSFPRQYARTQRFTLGEPRNITVSPDGRRVVFLRSAHGADPVNSLWVMDATSGEERIVADGRALLADEDESVPPEERARRERTRESAGGIVAFATNRDVTAAAFAVAGQLFVAGLVTARARRLPVTGPVFDPRPDPDGSRVAYVSGAALRLGELDGTSRLLVGEETADVTWGSADFIAGEEMNRQRGYWWSPDGRRIAVCRNDNSAVPLWWIADPAHPEREPVAHRYPAAGMANPVVGLHVLGVDDDHRVEIRWDAESYPYLADVSWSVAGLLITVQSRDQRALAVLRADPSTGSTVPLHVERDDRWVELVPGSPSMLPDGRVVLAVDRAGRRRLVVDGVAVSPDTVEVRSVTSCSATGVVFIATPEDDPTSQHGWRWDGARCEPLTDRPGVHTIAVGGPTTVVRTASLEHPAPRTAVLGGPSIPGRSERPLVTPNVRLLRLGKRRLATAVVLPRECTDDTRLPVLLDPYGGPHAQRVVSSQAAYLASQWLADQGFAVVVVDGRGTPGRGHDWDRAVHLDLAGPVLEDQIDGLHAAAELVPQIDLTRVGIRGWSFGGYLAALAVIRRPDVFHAAVAGAPVTDWRLYDTHYTERYLGDPTTDSGPYERCSFLTEAHRLTRPLLLIHGLADDNVVAAHTLQLSSALLASGRPHQVLPLSGVTHMTPQETVAENLLRLQVAFLREALTPTPRATGPVC